MAFDEKTKKDVWAKGKLVGTNDPAVWRQDRCGAWMNFDKYGDRDSQYGWEIDHIVPEAKKGSNELINLQPLQWANNAAKGDGDLVCAIKASGQNNGPA